MDSYDDFHYRNRHVFLLAIWGVRLSRRQEGIAVVLVLICSVGTILAVFGFESVRKNSGGIELLALEPAKGNWTPQAIRIKKGEENTLVIRNVDVVTHGFYLPALDIQVDEIRAGKSKRLRLLAPRQGEFPFYCSVWCSDHHMQMRGKLIVE